MKEKLYLSFINQVGLIKNKSLESFRVNITEIEARPLEDILPTL